MLIPSGNIISLFERRPSLSLISAGEDSLHTEMTQPSPPLAEPLAESCPSLELDDVMSLECQRQTYHRREKVWLPAVTTSFKTAADYGTRSSAVLAFQVHFALQWGIIVVCFIALRD